MLKKIVLAFFLYLSFASFSAVSAGYACNVYCGWVPSGCNTGLSCYAAYGYVCRSPSCPLETDCTCNKTCNSTCASNAGCASGYCDPTTHKCRSSTCPLETDCTCSKPCNSTCYSNAGCASNYCLISANKCRNLSCSGETDCTCKPPNCTNITGPAVVLNGDSVDYSSTFVNPPTTPAPGNGTVSSTTFVIYGPSPNGCATKVLNQTDSRGAGTYTYNWTASTNGTYTAYCGAKSSLDVECMGSCASSYPAPTPWTCTGPKATLNITVTDPQPWFKIKNSSLYKSGGTDFIMAATVKKFTDADADDDTNRNIIIGESGVATTDQTYTLGPSYNPADISARKWKNESYTITQTLIGSFLDYIKARKKYETITGLGANIKSDKVNLINGPLDIVNSDLNGSPNSFVLVVSGDVNINENLNTGATPKSVAIISTGTITFKDQVTQAGGIFIGKNMTIEARTPTDDNGIKIKGNLISENAITNNRTRTDNTRPSLFIVLDPKMYIDTLPYLSVSKYDWRQLQ